MYGVFSPFDKLGNWGYKTLSPQAHGFQVTEPVLDQVCLQLQAQSEGGLGIPSCPCTWGLSQILFPSWMDRHGRVLTSLMALLSRFPTPSQKASVFPSPHLCLPGWGHPGKCRSRAAVLHHLIVPWWRQVCALCCSREALESSSWVSLGRARLCLKQACAPPTNKVPEHSLHTDTAQAVESTPASPSTSLARWFRVVPMETFPLALIIRIFKKTFHCG